MNSIRVIPVLLLQGEGMVKTENFKNPIYIGDPINAVRIFNEKEVDELVLLDISATKQKRDPSYNWIKDIVSESFMPIGYGGGIKNIVQIKKLFDIGIEKVILNTAAFDLNLITEAASIYGNQSIVVCIDAKKNLLGGYNIYSNAGIEKHKMTPSEMAKLVVEAGAGEIIIQSIDKEGAMKGLDLALIKMVSKSVNVPIVATGGAGTLAHIKEAINEGGASAIAAGSLFVYKGKHRAVLINYPPHSQIDELFKND